MALLWAAALSTAALAENCVPAMELDVALRQDGSAYVTQVWTTDADEGTEFYLACNDSGYLSITDFSVSDGDGAYELLENWDVYASFEEKAGKCGIAETTDGVELCWGIGRYGENRYAIEYVLHDLVRSYSDADGFCHRFVDEMSFFPTDVTLTLRNQDGTPLNDELCDIWAFGFDGRIVFEDGVIRAWTDTPLKSGQSMTVMVSMGKGALSPLQTVEGSFETVKEQAFEGSDYNAADDEPLTVADILWMLGSLTVIAAAALGAVKLRRACKRARQKKQMESVDYFRDVPNGGDLNVSYALGKGLELCGVEQYIAARLLRLVTLGSLEPKTDADGQISMRFLREPHGGDPYDEALYTFLQAAAGQDGVLQEEELERFCADDRHACTLHNVLSAGEWEGERTLARGGCFRGTKCRRMTDLTERGREQWRELVGYKRYLLDFSLLSERKVTETFLWQECMVYAALLGIAERVLEQVRGMYPDQQMQVEQYQRYLIGTCHWSAYLSRAEERQRLHESLARGSGSGGRASLSGGGGFSGGGCGGTR